MQENRPTSYGMSRIVGQNEKFLQGMWQRVIPGYYKKGSSYKKGGVVCKYQKLMSTGFGGWRFKITMPACLVSGLEDSRS